MCVFQSMLRLFYNYHFLRSSMPTHQEKASLLPLVVFLVDSLLGDVWGDVEEYLTKSIPYFQPQ